MKDRRARAVSVAAAALFIASTAFAASIIPPENLGELALHSDAVVVAQAGAPRVSQRGMQAFTQTTFRVLAMVSGELQANQRITVEAPGGELDGNRWFVPGSPRFEPGATYLLFLNQKATGDWQPTMLAYGLLRRVPGRDGSSLLAPLADQAGILPFPRPDGILPEPIETYREAALLPHLRSVIGRRQAWDSRGVRARSEQIPLEVHTQSIPAGCAFMSSGNSFRWNAFDLGQSATMTADSTGDSSLAGGGFVQVQGALNDWMGVANTNMSLIYGGPGAYSMPCTGGQDSPSNDIVVFNDPCNDIADLVPPPSLPSAPCTGTLGYGGVSASGSHSFDGMTWWTINHWYVVVNNGAGCLGATNYKLMVEHELGHGLGFGHVSDPSALMYSWCCNSINATDTMCAQYAYPGGGGSPTPTYTPTPVTPTYTPTTQTVPAAPTNVQASDGTYSDRVRILWNASAGATSYHVYRNTSNDSNTATDLGSVTGTGGDDISAVAGTTYWYWAKGFNSQGGSPFSSPDTGYRATGGTPTPVTPTYTPTPVTPTYTPTPVTPTYTPTPTNPPGPTFTPTPAVTPTPTTVPASNVAVVAHNTGAGGTAWRSDVTLANPSDGALAVDLRYKASGGAVTTKGLSLAARETRLLGDVLVSFFGLGDGRGSLQIVPPNGGVAPAVASRTYNQTAAGNLGFGNVSLVPPAAGTYYIPGLYADTVARTNLGVTAGATGANATVTLYRGSAGQVGSTSLWIGAEDQQQWAVQDLFPGVAQAGVPMSVAVRLDGAAHAYATQVDQASGDTVFLSGSLSATSLVIPVVAHNTGAGGTYWRTDLYLFNPLALSSQVTLEYLPEGRDNSGGGTAQASVTLAPFASQTIADLVGTRFGVTQGKGSLAINATRPVIAASRCYTTRALGGTLGFGAPAVAPAALHTATRTLPGVRALSNYRTNIGLVTGTAGANVTLRLRNANGTVLATNSSVWVPPRSLYQVSLADAFPGAATPNPVGAVEVSTNAPLGAYLSVIDGSSQDPILVLAP